jgi:alpha-L-fucosidase
MQISRRALLAGAAMWGAGAPAPFGAVPSARQLRWHELETYAFLHFTVNTFTDLEWGNGDENPEIFNPTDFDADGMIEALAAGGMKGVILTCKHHDGFCLWPTRTTEHNISHSSWRGGKGDVVREISEAAARRHMKFGVYLSPWDRNSALYGQPEYIQLYMQQLRELLTGYGPVFEVWHDGANGGDGYYGGAREKRKIDSATYYQWDKIWELTRSLQPDAVIFSDVGPDVRWVGTEKGFAPETCWATYDPVAPEGKQAAVGQVRAVTLGPGTRNGSRWMPPECDVSIRPGWFWHEKENDKVKSPEELFDLYCRSVGHGASLLLNLPPDRRGRINEADAASLRAFGARVASAFGRNLLQGAKVHAPSTRRGSEFHVRHLHDGDRATYWCAEVGVTTAEIVADLKHDSSFNLIRLREHLPLGQRVDAFAVDQWQGGSWSPLCEGTSIGSCRIVRLKETAKCKRVRLRVMQAAACPALAEFGVY